MAPPKPHAPWVEHLGFDADGLERRRSCAGVVRCPTCGKDVELVAETDCWTEGADGRNHHHSYGPASGVCCDVLVVDSWDGCEAYSLDPAATVDDDDGDDDDSDVWDSEEYGGEG